MKCCRQCLRRAWRLLNKWKKWVVFFVIQLEFTIFAREKNEHAKMRTRLNAILNLVGHYKYLIVVVVGVAVVGFLDENSFMHRIKLDMQMSDLQSEIKKYTDRTEADTKLLNELKRNPQSIRKIAREQYFMKADDEDIFVLSDDPKKENNIVEE